MTEEKKLEPELRFPGFHEPWEEKKLGDVLEFKNGINKGKEYFGYGTPIINYMDVNRSTHLLKKDIEGLVFSNESEQKRYSVQKGDVFFTRTSETINEIGLASVLLEDIKNCVYSGFILRGRKIYTDISDLFAGYLYNTENVRIEIMRKSSKTTRALTNGKLLSEVNIITPSLQEQEKIGKFFYSIDKKLNLQRERVEELKSYKKGMMQRIFDQEIRFKDENGRDYPDWEEKKLNNILNERKEMIEKGRGVPHASLTKYGLELKTERYDRDFLVRDSNKKYKITKLNDICYNPANLKFGAITINKLGDLIISPIYVTFEISDTISPDYISYYFRRWDFINMVRKYEEGTVYERQAVKPEYFLKFKIKLPSLPEQEKIANFLSAIDKRIELEEEKLELYEDFKKGLMQRMFV